MQGVEASRGQGVGGSGKGNHVPCCGGGPSEAILVKRRKKGAASLVKQEMRRSFRVRETRRENRSRLKVFSFLSDLP